LARPRHQRRCCHGAFTW